jgi:hemin uptake protein HemP
MSTEEITGSQTIKDDKNDSSLANEAIGSESLLQGRDAVSIVHKGELYRLRQTRQGKLILTK